MTALGNRGFLEPVRAGRVSFASRDEGSSSWIVGFSSRSSKGKLWSPPSLGWPQRQQECEVNKTYFSAFASRALLISA
jgi:hypothetical protein